MTRLALTDRAVLTVSGADAAGFLQGLLTSDIERLNRGTACSTALLTPQGKILFDMILARGDDGFLIDCREDAADALAKRLSFYKLRAKIDIVRADDKSVVWTPPADPAAPDEFTDPRGARLGQRGFGHANTDQEGTSDYHICRIGHGIAEAGIDFEPDSVFPHEANLDLLEGVSFAKGCFIGQEVVSRMHHRGTARKRFLPCLVDGSIPPRGTEVIAGERTIGQVGSSAGGQALALLRLDHLEDADKAGIPITAGDARLSPRIPDWMGEAAHARRSA